MDQIQIAVAGLGGRGLHWIHLLQKIRGYRIVAICDPDKRLHEAAIGSLEKPSDVKVYSDYSDVLADKRVDAVALVVRCQEQGALAAQALEAGKHVNAEVPAAHSIDDCWKIVLAAERTGKVYHLAEQVRYWGFIEAWRALIARGDIGRPVLCEGEYYHFAGGFFLAKDKSGQWIPFDEISKMKDRALQWGAHMPPIHYLPHELSPMLKVLDDRVTEVVAMSTPSPSFACDVLPCPDLQMALMKTEKGTVLRMSTSFTCRMPHGQYHWYYVKGTHGIVESPRGEHEKFKFWQAGSQMRHAAEVDWTFARQDGPREALGSGHGDVDYYVHAAFRDALLHGKQPEMDLYTAMDTAAPAILAAESIAKGSAPMKVPDFRPGPNRKRGEKPRA
ncbi:MAG TPA: Gfo/Idh/MocA family oxidoreductase [Planctomycetota bacterium]|nr:Gfo/Idh/MocA family oxidoreductase [Planctomycetota bacterium]